MNFNHFIGTRFNLKVESWHKNKNGNTVLSEEWLNHRIEIFKKYFLPSVLNQSSKNFTWCIFFDIDTPQVHKEKIQILLGDHKFITPIFINDYSELVPKFKSFIERNKTFASHIITTRIDNDDIIHRDFVKTIQSLFRPNDLCVIDLRRGYQLSIDVEPAEVRNYSHPFNAFLSIIEPVNSCSTIYSRQHYHWKNEKTIVYEKKRLWIELSHDENYVNHRQVKLKMSYSFEPKRFALSEQFQIDVFNAFIENSRIDLMNMQLFILDLFGKIKKIPFRARRWVLKNISRETKKNIRVFLYEYNISRPRGPWPYISNRLKKYLVKNVRLHDSNETLAVIRWTIENKESGAYMRFGDGDIHLMNGLDDILNKCNDSLSREMKEAIGIKGKNVHKTLPISSNLFGFEPGMKDGVHLVRDIDALRYLAVCRRKINLKKIYSTTALHYMAEHSPEACVDFLKFLRKNEPIFVGNRNLKASLIKYLFGNVHIKTPPNNAYLEIDRIENELTLELIKSKDNFKVVVLAMGCSGRVLQKRMLKKGFNIYLFDFGSLLDALNGDQTRAWVRLTGGPNYYKALLSKI